MVVLRNKRELEQWRLSVDNIKTIGFVPTMGALHKGHISLVKKSISENDFTVVSIFVNPTQFNNPSDFEKYPNTIASDLEQLSEVNCGVVYIPSIEDLYPNFDTSIKEYTFSGIEKPMEGEFRPGHFDGVATVVKKLFDAVLPSKAYFGEKDYQQLLIVKELVGIEKMPIKIIGMPIYREKDGLAMSSRNMRLNDSQRKEAPLIFNSLLQVKKWVKEKESINEITDRITEIFSQSNLKLEYFEVRENNSLKFAQQFEKNKKYRAFISVFAGEIRLIDNLELF